MSEIRRVVYVGDEEGEIELSTFLKHGWKVHFGVDGKIVLIDGMVAIYKAA